MSTTDFEQTLELEKYMMTVCRVYASLTELDDPATHERVRADLLEAIEQVRLSRLATSSEGAADVL